MENINKCIGEKISKMFLDDDKLHIDKLHIEFKNNTKLTIYDDGQDCNELRYLSSDGDDLSYYNGATFFGIDIRKVTLDPSPEDIEKYEKGDDDFVVHEVAFITVKTSKGEQVFSSHIDHNGYYGDFVIRAEIK